MMRTGTDSHNSTTNLDPPEGSELSEPVLSVPLAAAELNKPFETVNQATSGAASRAANRTSNQTVQPNANRPVNPAAPLFKTIEAEETQAEDKSRPANSRSQTTDQATANLTVPLRARLLLVFGGLAALFLVCFGLVIYLFVSLSGQGQATVNQQTRLDRLHQLQLAFLGEQAAIGRLVANAEDKPASPDDFNDFEFRYYQTSAENSLYLLEQAAGPDDFAGQIVALKQRHANLSDSYYTQIVRDLKSGGLSTALDRWAACAALTQDLTARLQLLDQQETARADAHKSTLTNWQLFGLIALLVLSIGGLIVLLVLIWLANRVVIGPMGRLNVKLGQLLYGQTTRITDRLNLLELEREKQTQRVAGARHDLKLPLSNIRNAAELTLLYQPNLNEETRENLQEIIETSDSSARQINALLAREDDRLELAWVDLRQLVQRVVDLVDLRDFSLKLEVKLDQVRLDEQLIEHVLLNLLSNARKFSQGGIGIGTRLAENYSAFKSDSRPEAELWVWNDGSVISAGDREAIFRPGYQTEAGKQAGGHGIGLSIVKTVVERHGGRITIESHQKVGTTFRVFLPYTPCPAVLAPLDGD